MTILPQMLLLAVLSTTALGHQRLVCPSPRSQLTGAKVAPCDVSIADANGAPVTSFSPGWNTLSFEEVITHYGAPSRVALGLEGKDEGFDNCVLLDHLPHRDNGAFVPML